MLIISQHFMLLRSYAIYSFAEKECLEYNNISMFAVWFNYAIRFLPNFSLHCLYES